MRGASRLLFLAGAVAIGLLLFRASPRDVILVYGLAGEPARGLDVDIRKGGELVRHAEFRFPSGAPPAVRHAVRLTDGDYVLQVRVLAEARSRRVERPITVSESGTIVIPLGS